MGDSTQQEVLVICFDCTSLLKSRYVLSRKGRSQFPQSPCDVENNLLLQPPEKHEAREVDSLRNSLAVIEIRNK
jgi:hypothetical protein